jgi:hypothetical protein
MSSDEMTLPTGDAQPRKLTGWRLACAVFSGILVAPVLALVLGLVLATALPFLLVSPLVAGTWARRGHAPPISAVPPFARHVATRTT